LYTVPAGKELVVNGVSANLAINNGTALGAASILHTAGGTAGQFWLPLTLQNVTLENVVPVLGSGPDSFSGAMMTQFYADPGTDVKCKIDATVSDNPNLACSIDGYLVNLPS
jgi:hypothetical protein